jgi:cytoskeletal protein CcmA (bactofilin family)
MWRRDKDIGPPAPSSGSRGGIAMAPEIRNPIEPRPVATGGAALIGRSVVIKGELDGSEGLTIEGQVEGKIELRDHTLTVGQNGRVKAQVFAKSVVVFGELVGNINASETVDIRDNGSVEGDIVAPRVAIAEGAHFRGSIDMQRKEPAATKAVVPSTASSTGPPAKSPTPPPGPLRLGA